MSGVKTYKNIAAMQNPGGQRTGKAAGGRVKKQGGGVTSIRGRGGPNVRPKVNVLGVGAAQAHQAAQRSGLAGQQAAAQTRRGAGTAGLEAPDFSGLPHEKKRPPAPKIRPGYKKGGRTSKAKGGKAKR